MAKLTLPPLCDVRHTSAELESDFVPVFETVAQLMRGFRLLLKRALREQQLLSRYPGVIFGSDVIILGESGFFPGKGVFIDQRAYLNCAGGDWNNNAGFIKIGDNSEIGPYSVLWGAGGITIGDNVHLGAHVSITAHEAHQVGRSRTDAWFPLEFEFAPVVIEDHALICSGAVIVPGVRIGHHAMIGGGSVVTKDIPAYALAVGCPARVIRFVDSSPDGVPAQDVIGGWDLTNLRKGAGVA